MGRLSHLPLVAGLLLVGGVALAQQGLIVEPWRKAPLAATLPAPRLMPSSGLPQGVSAPANVRKPEPPVAVGAARQKWSPPVLELLVDPWAKAPTTAAVARPRWEPRAIEIVDPWAGAAPAPPRLASRPRAVGTPAPIF